MSWWTPSHSVLLSHLLDDVIGTHEMVQIRQEYCRFFDCYLSADSKFNIYFTGSKAEGLDLPGSDSDYMQDINSEDIEVIEHGHAVPQSHGKQIFMMVTDNVHPAFAMLRLITPPTRRITFESLNVISGSYFLSSYLTIMNHASYQSNCRNTVIQGPSIEHSDSDYDLVNSIHCPFWPNVASEWVRRTRFHDWPTIDTINEIKDFGFHLVPIGYQPSPMSMMEWRTSFSIAEKILVWSFNHIQIQFYAILKLVQKEFIKTNCNAENYVICSYFMKTFLFWKFEETDKCFWKIENFRECLKYLLIEFHKILQKGILKHYFIPNFNLLEVKLNRNAQLELLQLYDHVIQYDIKIIERCQTLRPIWMDFSTRINDAGFQQRPLIETNDLLTRIFKKSFTNAMKLKVDKSRKLLTLLMQCKNKELLDILKACATTSSSLDSFTFKYFRLMYNIPRHTCWPESNKHMYSICRHFDASCNDIMTSKLWSAIVFLLKTDYKRALLTINKVLSSIPPYALYYSSHKVVSSNEAEDLYQHNFFNSDLESSQIEKRAWIFDIRLFKNDIPVLPAAIQMELIHANPEKSLYISPFTFAYYLQFLCYHGLRQYENRDRALRQLVEVTDNPEQYGCMCLRHHSYNIAGHCLWFVGKTACAREMFLKSCEWHILNGHPDRNDYNAARHYLRSYMYDIEIDLD